MCTNIEYSIQFFVYSIEKLQSIKGDRMNSKERSEGELVSWPPK